MTAFMIVPFEVSDGNFVFSNVPENDYALWDVGSTYALGGRVISTVTHLIYESVSDGNTGNDPTSAANVPMHWLVVGSTNRWRPFDASLGQAAVNDGSIQYTIGAITRLDAVAFIGLVATSVRVLVRNPTGGVTYDQTANLLDASDISDWLDFVTFDGAFDNETVFEGMSAVAGSSFEITIATLGGVAEVAEIIAGKAEPLGIVLEGTRSGFTDYSRRVVDDFGNISIVKRPTARRAEWEISFPTKANRRIQRAIEDARGAPAFFYPGPDMNDFYISVYGVADDFFPSLQIGERTQATLSLTGAA